MNQNGFSRYSAKQKGAVLITGLIFLVVLTMLVLAIMRSATLEERMAGNSRNRQLALQAAEAVLRDAEVSLFAPAATFTTAFDPTVFNSTCTNGYCSRPAAGTYRWKAAATWANGTSRSFATLADGTAFSLAGLPSPPRYIVEYMGPEDSGQPPKICPKLLFRVTVRGVGNDSSIVYLQNNYRLLPIKFADGYCG